MVITFDKEFGLKCVKNENYSKWDNECCANFIRGL